MAKSIRMGRNAILKMAKLVVNSVKEDVSSEELASSLAITDAAAKELLTEMAEAGDIDRYYPPQEEGKRGRQAARFRPMSPERAAQLEPVIRCREAVAVKLGRNDIDAKVTLGRVTLTLQDMAKLLDVPYPEVSGFENNGDEDDED